MKKFKVLILSIIMVMLVVWYYQYLSNKTDSSKKGEESKEIDILVNKNLNAKYPETPREVVKLYNRIMLCYYNDKCTNEQLVGLTAQARTLYDQELLDKNPYDEYFKRLIEEIDQYKSDNRKITSCMLAGSREVEDYTIKKEKYASIQCIYYSKGDKGTIKSDETYVLRKDDKGKWKILYWKLNGEEDE